MPVNTLRCASMVAVLALGAGAVRAQQQGPPAAAAGVPGKQPGQDLLLGSLFPPELIMQNQAALGLTADQQREIIAEIQRTQTQATPLQWRLQGAVQRLTDLVKVDHPDEAQVLAQLDTVLATEREMKRAQLTLLVRLKNHLGPDQQTFLRRQMAQPQGPSRND